MDDASQAGSGSEDFASNTSFPVVLVDLFRESTMHDFTALLYAAFQKGKAIEPHSEVQIAFSKLK